MAGLLDRGAHNQPAPANGIHHREHGPTAAYERMLDDANGFRKLLQNQDPANHGQMVRFLKRISTAMKQHPKQMTKALERAFHGHDDLIHQAIRMLGPALPPAARGAQPRL
jgi:hypothetical protein